MNANYKRMQMRMCACWWTELELEGTRSAVLTATQRSTAIWTCWPGAAGEGATADLLE